MNRTSLQVLLIDAEVARGATLRRALTALGHRVVAHLPSARDLCDQVARLKADLVMVDMDAPDRETLDNMSALSSSTPRPIVFFAERASDAATISAAINAGVSAYIADGQQPGRVGAIIATALGHFHSAQQLRDELARTRNQLSERKVVEKAKGLLMKHHRCDEEQAYKILRNLAMDRSKKLATVAGQVIEILAPAAGKADGAR